MVPGHEIVGEVVEVGSAVTDMKAGDRGGIGCMVQTCGNCRECQAELEQVKLVFMWFLLFNHSS